MNELCVEIQSGQKIVENINVKRYFNKNNTKVSKSKLLVKLLNKYLI